MVSCGCQVVMDGPAVDGRCEMILHRVPGAEGVSRLGNLEAQRQRIELLVVVALDVHERAGQ